MPPQLALRNPVRARLIDNLTALLRRQALCSLRIMKPVVFIERDGILNAPCVEKHQQVSPLTMDQFHINTQIVPLLNELKAAGLLLIVTTNQPGLSRGYQSRRELDR